MKIPTVFRDAALGGIYRRVLKPVLFRADPEQVHDTISGIGARLGRWTVMRAMTRAAFDYRHPLLRTSVAGLSFDNPIGLSAGFDKEGNLAEILPDVGFGFMEIGSVTGSPSPGNPKPRLWRLPKSQALAVYLGLNSRGSEEVARRLVDCRFRLPVGLSLAKANLPAFDGLDEGIADYVRASRHLADIGQFRVINISCPNTTGGEPFAEPRQLELLLRAVMPHLQAYPVWLKLPADADLERLGAIASLAMEFNVAGFVCTNLTTQRSNPAIRDADVPARGGLSGKIVEAKSNEVLAHLYRRTKGRAALIGVGGVFTAMDAYRKIRLGASLVELITGMIYRGPSVVSEIKRGLVELLQRDGLSSVAAAVGVDVR